MRTSGKAARNEANGSHKAALLIARTLHIDPPNHFAAATARQFATTTCKPQAFQTQFSPGLIIPLCPHNFEIYKCIRLEASMLCHTSQCDDTIPIRW